MRDVVLRLALRNYERARELAGALAERADRTLATARSVGAELRDSAEQARKAGQERERARPKADAPRASGRSFGQVFGAVNSARERGEALAGVLAGGGEPSQAIPRLMGLAGAVVPGIGPFLSFLAPLTEKLLARLEEKLAQELARREERLVAQLTEDAFRADYNRRFAEDPRFAREQARLAFEHTLVEEAARGPRLERTTADLVADFGL